jgi:hypothetical protein
MQIARGPGEVCISGFTVLSGRQSPPPYNTGSLREISANHYLAQLERASEVQLLQRTVGDMGRP